MGTKNLLDHSKHYVAFRGVKSHTECASSSTTDSIDTSSDSGGRSISSNKTLDSYVKRSGKRVSAATNSKICEQTASLVAAAQLPYCFVEHS